MTKPCRYYQRHLWTEGGRVDKNGLEYRECFRGGCGVVQWARYSLKTRRHVVTGALVPINLQWVWQREKARMPQGESTDG